MNMKGVMCTVILLLAATLLVLPVSGAFNVTGTNPVNGTNTGWVYVDISGNELPEEFSVILTNGPAGTSNITGQYKHFYNTEWISCFFDLNGEKAGARTVVVVNTTDGSEAVLEGIPFLVENLPPTVSSVTPISGINNQDSIDLTVEGSDFLEGATVVLTDGTSTIQGKDPVVTATRINCSVNVSGAAAGKWSVEVTNPDGKTGVLKDGFTILTPAPTVTIINPSGGANDDDLVSCEVEGSGFLSDLSVALVKEGQTAIPASGTTMVSDIKIGCFFNLTNTHVGSWDVVVTNKDGQSGTLAGGFFITYPAAPKPTAVDPATGVNTGIVTITDLSGTGFEEGATVVFTKGLATIAAENVVVNSPANITCTVNLTGAEIGQWNITVTNDDGQSGTLFDEFEVIYPAPEITGISPPSGANNVVVPVVISGAFFRETPEVHLTRDAATISGTNVTYVNAGTLKCDLPLTSAALGNWSLVVMNPDMQSSAAVNFTVENPRPTVSGITPSKGTNNTVVAVTISGAYFLSTPTAPRVNLTMGTDIIPGENVTVMDPRNITCEFNLNGRALGQWNLIVVNPDGKTGGLRNAFRITTPPPVPDFTASPTYGTVPLTVQFTDLSTNYPYIWSWNFGDGSIVTGINQANPVHVYNTPGVYSVTLYALNSDGVGEKITKLSYVTVVETPVAHFTATPMSGPAPLFVQFTDTSDGDPYRWAWKFGDGQISDQKNPYFLYKNPGMYQVELTVYNKAGSDTATKTIEVLVSPPDAEFTANRTAGDSPLTVRFTDISTGSPTSWSWKFGDSGSSDEQNPVYVFSSPGTYGVQLTASNAAGTSTETKNGYIVVGQPIKANFSYTPSNEGQTAPLSVAFSDLSSGNVLKWNWNFGDAHISTERNPIHTYPAPGTYTITLSVLGLTGSDSVTKTITVVAPLIADFIAEPTTGSAPLTIVLSDRSTGDVATREWVIMDNPEEYAKNIVYFSEGQGDQMYTLTEPGLYTVRLTIRDANGKPDSEIKTNYINVLPFL
ncbi:MAG: PKD domain protein [Euryarchaeota archaeon ADurb.BinA087]|nr:MAG: PKD domain protein [Euryarchaeota archaeon ADurb.BinA087]